MRKLIAVLPMPWAAVVLAGVSSCGSGNSKGPDTPVDTCPTGTLDCGCYANSTCNQDANGLWLFCDAGRCTKPHCPQGSLGCGCYVGATCDEGLYCSGASGAPRCELPSCVPGALACGCRPDRTCDASDQGIQLVCDGKVCIAPACTPGAANCTCRPDYGCDAGLVCGSGGRCGTPTCTAGELGCGCLPDGSCQSASLVCGTDGKCQARTCEQGTAGCGCFSDFTCTQGTGGAMLVCHAGKCVAATCPEGQPGCPCKTDQTCTGGTCQDGFCIASETTLPPADPKCYVPCLADLVHADGTLDACPADGLMAMKGGNCLDGRICKDGSCVEPGEAAPACTVEVDCPDYQTCIQGRCYSNCDLDTDCPEGRECYRHVCRTPCNSASPTCPPKTACVTVDGDSGFCMPVHEPAAQAQTEVLGTFEVSSDVLEFTSSHPSGKLTLTNHAPVPVQFTVTKVDHQEASGTGFLVVSDGKTEHFVPSAGGLKLESTSPQGVPLQWLQMGTTGGTTKLQSLKVTVDANGGSVDLFFDHAANPTLAHWEGHIQVSSPLGTRLVGATYVSLPEGQWRGTMYYFGNFGDANLEAWMKDPSNETALKVVGNALVRRWGAFRKGTISFAELQALLTATVTGSWAWKSTLDACAKAALGAKVCYLWAGDDGKGVGVGPYTNDPDGAPVPSAVTELPIAMNLRQVPGQTGLLEGRLATSESLHYAGNPALSLAFQGDPASCAATPMGDTLCFVKAFDSVIRVGGRYATSADDQACAQTKGPGGKSSFALVPIPWLVPKFEEGTDLDSNTGIRHRYECRDSMLPFGAGPLQAQNQNLAQSNPIPDGRARQRALDLVDGALVNQTTLVVLFRERYEQGFLGDADHRFAAYGLMMLTRSPAELEDADYAGSSAGDYKPPEPTGILGTTCSQAIVDTVLGPGTKVQPGNVSALAIGVLQGFPSTTLPDPIKDLDEVKVHYLCHDTGVFDGGPLDTGTGPKQECPIGSNVTYFTATLAQADIAKEPCQTTGKCQATLDLWKANQSFQLRLDPVWRCEDPEKVYCDEDRKDLRLHKLFYAKKEGAPVFVPLASAIDDAFRYKTRFKNRQGKTVGFAPDICVPDSNAIPYCYDPPSIEEIRHRVDCALDLFVNHYDDLQDTKEVPARGLLRKFLTVDFGHDQDNSVFPPLKHEGFEWLYAELLVMMGDEAYTSAFASRFDLAGMNLQSFQGSLFEPGGMDLAGGAGYEMFNLYLSTQYYQMALDRFYAMSPYLWQALKAPDRNFVSINTVEDYFARLIRASTQKSRAFSEIAKRYQSFNRSDLARRVAERGYATAYLEDVILSRMLLGVVATADPQARDYIRKRADLAALGYKAALLDMRDVYRTLTEQVTYFGFAPDYIPFPALGPGDVNAFTKLLAGAEKSVGVAAEKEILALNASTSYETDSALFEQELVRLRNNYENQLADLCGTFTGSDGLVHPAIRAYAYLDERAGTFGDPCGLMGTGQLNEAMGRLETIGVDLKSVRQQYTDVLAAIDIERQRVAQQCGLTQKLADFKIKQAQKTKTIGDVIAETQDFIGEINGTLEKVGKVANLMKCAVGTSSDCASAAAAMSYYLSWDGICDVAMQEAQKLIEQKKDEIAVVEQESVKIESQQPCATAQVDSEAAIRKEHLKLAELDLQTLKTQYELRLAAAEIRGLRDKATRLQAEMEEMEQQTINVEAARNDPNVRIYKNDAILTADRTFQDALKAVYRATKVFEYYTSQSYARLDSLFLVRMVSHGDYSLEGYLSDLEKAYYDFQELYGNPDVRVEVLSLRDDVLSVPRLDADGAPRTQAARVDDLRKALADPGRLDESGFVRLPFSTTRSRLSPLTRNHKILRLEAEMIGSDIGDTVGRLYVAQVGTGTVVGVDGASEYYRFPERTAVLNPFFNGVRVYSPDVYTNDHLRDRPLLNTHWDLVINQKDEAANQDINLQSLTDVRLYIYYTDFTQF